MILYLHQFNQNSRKMRNYILNGILICLILSITSCDIVTGEGPIVEKGFAVDKFSSIELDGSFDVNLSQGTTQNVVAKGNENIIDKLRLTVSEETLYLSLEPGNYMNYDLEVNLTVPSVEQIVLNGSGDIHISTFVGISDLTVQLDGSGDIKTTDDSVVEVKSKAEVMLEGSGDIDLHLKVNSVTATLDGSGDIDLAGSANSLNAELDGSGDIKAFDLEALKGDVSLDGSGSIKVFVTKALKASLDGSGDIEYRGEPKLEASVDGAGTISAD